MQTSTGTSSRDLAKIPLIARLYRDLTKRPLIGILCKNHAKRSLAERPLTGIIFLLNSFLQVLQKHPFFTLAPRSGFGAEISGAVKVSVCKSSSV